MITYKWGYADDVAEVMHKACELTPEVSNQIGDLNKTKENLKRFEVLGIFDNEAPIGAFIFLGKEFHAAILPEYRGKWMNKQFIKIMLNEKDKRNGLFTTINEASSKVELSVLHFCNRYKIEVKYV